MSSLIKEIKAVSISERAIKTGQVISRQSNNFYQVNVDRQKLLSKSLIPEELPPGKYVAVLKIKGEYFIISSENIRSQQREIVYVRS